MPSPAIEVVNLRTELGGVVVHDGLNLQVDDGEVLAIVGGSGSGKTTLLRLMLGLQAPSAGEVRVLGHPLGACGRHELARVQQRRGVLFQQGALFSALSVLDNVALPLRELRTLPPDVVRELALRALAQAGIEAEHARKMPAELSGGMVKRVALARALVLGPSLLFLDEPTAGLDPQSSKAFVRLVRELRQEMRLTVVMVTHDVDTLCALADRVAVLADRHVVAIGPLAEVAPLPHPFVRSFFLGHQSRCQAESLRRYRESLHEPAVAA
ncbi:MAG: ATP-binding cassette domain-containing protein [Burkholderiales bacterium]|nr:ATP-binding cassette domain-containing protein [Burkholderiales bacterium]MDE2567014.1 ATP-binding cassette domain-containing protein [Burkholderiales bacterium]